MPHVEVKNSLAFEFGVQHLANSEGTPVAVSVVKATYSMQPGGLQLAEKQIPVFPFGVPNGKLGESSYKYEPDCCYFKPRTDVILIGAAYPESRNATQVDVQFSVGKLRKFARVFGDRFWVRRFGGASLMGPEPFEAMPLMYERAFGGWDRTDPDPSRHTFDPRNPIGIGFQRNFAEHQDRIAIANIEDPRNLITSVSSLPNPIGFGFTSPDWQPRAALAGTYDAAWQRTRMPLLPEDFDPQFFNAAPEGLVADGYLAGDELVTLSNCSARGLLQFCLPGIPPPRCRFRVAGRGDTAIASVLDTVVVNAVEDLVVMTWRCHVQLPRGPEQLLALEIGPGE